MTYSISGISNTFKMETRGVQVWTTPYDATFKVTAAGAHGGAGGSRVGGSGRIVSRAVFLPRGTKVHMVVGQEPNIGSEGSGGGGGTFVYLNDVSKANVMLVAGGGGGYGGRSTGGVVTNGAPGTEYTFGSNGPPGDNHGSNGGSDGGSGGGTGGGTGINTITTTLFVGGVGPSGVHGGFGGGGGSERMQGTDTTGTVPSGIYYVNGGGGGGYSGGGGGALYNYNHEKYEIKNLPEQYLWLNPNWPGSGEWRYKTETIRIPDYKMVTGPGGGGGSFSPISEGYDNNVGLNSGSGYVILEVISTPAPTTQAPTTPAPTTQSLTIAGTLAPTSAAPVTPSPTSMPPPAYLRYPPNFVILVHEGEWMNSGALKVMTLRGSTPSLQTFAYKDLTQVFAIDSNGSVRTIAAQGDYLNHATNCDGVLGGSSASQWRFVPRNLPRSYALEVVCSSTLGTKRIDYNSVNNPWGPFLSASTGASTGWFIVPVARIESA